MFSEIELILQRKGREELEKPLKKLIYVIRHIDKVYLIRMI